MPLGVINLEWLNLNSQRAYPLAEGSSATDTSDSFIMPTDFLVGLDLPIHHGLSVDPARFFLKTIQVYAGGFVLVVGYQPAVGAAVEVATSFINRATHTPNKTYALGGVGDFTDTVGKLVIARFDGIDSQPAGAFDFTLAAARIDPDCVRPILRCLTSIAVVNGTGISPRMYGDIELVAEDNVQLVPVIVGGQDPKIRISAVDGQGLNETCVCEGDAEAPPIRRINGIPGTPGGDFTLLGDECLRFDAVANGLKAVDSCNHQPCCGCAELEAVTRALETFGSKAATLENFLNRLEASVGGMEQTVLGSKLNDRSCTACE